MTLLAPLWLLALLPWAAFAAWMLVGRRRRQRVPFLPLWNAPEELRRPKKGFEPPPASLLFALLATLLATFALARPLASSRAPERHLTIVLDRGASMSARFFNGPPRFAAVAEVLAKTLANSRTPVTLDLITVPPTGGNWRGSPEQLGPAVSALRRTAVDTATELQAVVSDLAAKGQTVLVISDHDLGLPRPNVISVNLPSAVDNAGITAIAERAGQVMVTIATNRPTVRTLVLRSGDKTTRQEVTFTSPGQRNLFLTFDPPTDTIEATLEDADDFDADDRAFLVRGRPWPLLEPRSPLPDELRRMIDVYRHLRPPSDASPRLAIGRPADVKSDEPGVLLAPFEPAESPRGEVRPVPHPITAGVDWKGLTSAALATASPPDGWTILARIAERPILAVRDAESRQAWVGFDSSSFARTPGFVVLWTNLFDHLAAGDPDFHADILRGLVADATRLLPPPPPDADPTRWPGVFQTPTGQSAFNAPTVTFSDRTDDWTTRLANLTSVISTSLDLTPWLALTALACLTLAAATWERRRTPALKPPAHLDVETLHLIETTFNADGHAHRHETLRPPHD